MLAEPLQPGIAGHSSAVYGGHVLLLQVRKLSSIYIYIYQLLSIFGQERGLSSMFIFKAYLIFIYLFVAVVRRHSSPYY